MSGFEGDPRPHTSVPIDRLEALRLLADAGFGRVVYTREALPAIRPVNHLVEDGVIIVRIQLTCRLTTTVHTNQDVVVAYQADHIDPALYTGWSVVVTGIARPVTDPERIARYENLLQPWLDETIGSMVEIHPSIVTGVRFTTPVSEVTPAHA